MKIKFSTDNAAFDEYPELETARILNKITTEILDHQKSGLIIDINGNIIGSWEL